jgi:Leucine-rich repeat (LRR) protein
MTSHTFRHWGGRVLLILAVIISNTTDTHADDSDEANERKAAIAAILQAGGYIRVVVPAPTVDRLERLSIDEVNLRKAKVDIELLSHVGKLKEIRRLDLSYAEIDDESIRKIAHLPLRELWLQSTKITDASAATISEITTLDFLQLNSTQLSDEFLKQLKSMPNLRDFGLRGTQVTGDGMRDLSRHPKLMRLDIYHTEVDDAGVEALTDCKSLTFVGLSLTKITEGVFQHLFKMPNLTNADLSGNRTISTAAVLAFEEKYPQCDIEWYGK